MRRAILNVGQTFRFAKVVGTILIVLLPGVGLFAQEIALTSDSYWHYYPEWSQDGNWIVYQKEDATGYSQIYKVSSEVGIEETASFIPDFFSLKIRPTVSLSSLVVCDYGIKRQGRVSLRIYDIAGKLVKELLNRNIEPGNYTIILGWGKLQWRESSIWSLLCKAGIW